jgi:hypothetical protein
VTVSDTVRFSDTNALAVIATVAGNVAVTTSGGQNLIVPVAVGLTVLPFSIVQLLSTGTTATATYARLY